MPFVTEFAAALGGATPARVQQGLRVIADFPWLSIVKIDLDDREVTNMHFDPDAAETGDVLEALNGLRVGAEFAFTSDKIRTLGSAREVTVQFVKFAE